MNNKIDWFIGTFLGVLHSFLVNYVYKVVPEPYMDEIFHIDQARRFCALNFTWNPKITTPPALYVLSLTFFCGYERYTNSALIPFAFVGCMQFRQLFQKPFISKLNFRYLEFTLSSLIVLLLPVLFQSSLLYYTDLLSLTTLLWASSLQPIQHLYWHFLLKLIDVLGISSPNDGAYSESSYFTIYFGNSGSISTSTSAGTKAHDKTSLMKTELIWIPN
ncbi:DIE2/ALG10 family protein [Brugia pahangi]